MGEIVKVQKDGFFPADILLLSTSSDDGICYVETINLDGESNLKIKKALDATKKLDDTGLRDFKVRGFSFQSRKHKMRACIPRMTVPASASDSPGYTQPVHWLLQGQVQCEQPNASLYTFTGNLLLDPPVVENSLTLPLTPASIVLRGCSLRNTGFITGAVIFAGHETKVSLGWPPRAHY